MLFRTILIIIGVLFQANTYATTRTETFRCYDQLSRDARISSYLGLNSTAIACSGTISVNDTILCLKDMITYFAKSGLSHEMGPRHAAILCKGYSHHNNSIGFPKSYFSLFTCLDIAKENFSSDQATVLCAGGTLLGPIHCAHKARELNLNPALIPYFCSGTSVFNFQKPIDCYKSSIKKGNSKKDAYILCAGAQSNLPEECDQKLEIENEFINNRKVLCSKALTKDGPTQCKRRAIGELLTFLSLSDLEHLCGGAASDEPVDCVITARTIFPTLSNSTLLNLCSTNTYVLSRFVNNLVYETSLIAD